MVTNATDKKEPYRVFRTRMVCLDYIAGLGYAILARNPRYIEDITFDHKKYKTNPKQEGANQVMNRPTQQPTCHPSNKLNAQNK